MTSATLAGRIRANRKSRSPVQDTVEAKFDEIAAAIAAGCSYEDIYAQLNREGHNVGAGRSSLYAAFQAVRAQRLHSASGVPSDRPATAPVRSTASPSDLPRVVVDDRRKTTDWG